MQRLSVDPAAIRRIAKRYNMNPNYVFLLKYATFSSDVRIFALEGGTRSGKTYSVLSYLIDAALDNLNAVVSIVRETTVALAGSVERMFVDILKTRNLYDRTQHHLTRREYRLNGTLFEFFGADNPQKLRSTERDILFANEVNGFRYESFNELAIRTKRYIIIDYNPTIPLSHFIFTKILNRPDVLVFKSNYLDNLDNLLPSQVQEIEMLKITNPERYQALGLGEWVEPSEKIFKNIEIVKQMPDNLKCVGWGLDTGYNDPSTLVLCGYADHTLYIDEYLYQRGLTDEVLAKECKQIIPPALQNKFVVCDSARPSAILALRRAGLNAIGVQKVAKTIRGFRYDVINEMLNYRIAITERSVNALREFNSYTWQTKHGQVLDEPIDYDDHTIDAVKYWFWTFADELREIRLSETKGLRNSQQFSYKPTTVEPVPVHKFKTNDF